MTMRRAGRAIGRRAFGALICAGLLLSGPAATTSFAQPVATSVSATASVPAPAASTLSRDADGRIVVRAARVDQAMRIDARLDEAIYSEVPPITEFIQQVPREGAPGTEKTEAWVLFDDDNIYLAARNWDEHPERIIANEMRRDGWNSQHDHIGVVLDTFHDQRNGFLFMISAIGALRDAATTDERPNFDWNGIWDGKARRFESGWITEIAIPFKSLRYRPGRDQTWGIQMRRGVGSKNEIAYITPTSAAWGNVGINHLSAAATLVGLEAPPAALNLEVKPYALSRLTTDQVRVPPLHNDFDPDAGVDVKYGLTKSMTADFTYNTDFAQVEVDEAQVNLTRFSLSYPEKREFFLEGQGIFGFGNGVGPSIGGGDQPVIFYSRRIGLNGSNVVPVIAGGRLTGRAGPWSVGALNMETDEAAGAAQTNFTVLRVRRNVLRRSNVGGLFTNRSVSAFAPGSNQVFGLDANLAFYENVYVGGYLAGSGTEGLNGQDLAYDAQFNYAADRYGFAVDRLVVEDNFSPEVGLLRRENYRRNYAQARFSPRTRNNPVVRKWTYQSSIEYITDNDNRLESRELLGEFATEFHSSDNLSFQYSQLYEGLRQPFRIHPGVIIPIGAYSFDNFRASYTAGQQHRISGSASVDAGSFYDGTKQTLTFRGRVGLATQLSIEPNISLNWVDLPYGAFTTSVVGSRVTYTMTPRMFVSALVQYASSTETLSSNVRFRWEYLPGSELFIVYSEGRSTTPLDATSLENRGFVVKINRLFRY
jgi:hypothetical protein